MAKLGLIIENPNSGQGNKEEALNKLKAKLEGAFDSLVVKKTEKENDANRFACEACQEGVDSLFILGGDGTVNEVFNGLAKMDNRPKIAVLPGGTNNTYYQVLGGNGDLDQAIDGLSLTETIRVDIGECNGHYFSYYACFGRMVDATTSTTSKEKEAMGPLAYLKNLAMALPGDKTYQVNIQSDGENYQGPASHIYVFLTNQIGNLDFSTLDNSLNNGAFSVFILTDAKLLSKATALRDLIFGSVDKNDSVHAFNCRSLTIEETSGDQVDLDLDGEVGPKLPAEIKILPSHFEIYVPGSVDQ